MMKILSMAFSVVLICGVILTACAPQTQAAQPPPPSTTEPPTASIEQPTTAVGQEASPTAPAASVQHNSVPGELPGKERFLGDQSTVSSSSTVRALVGDRFTLGQFERPYNANTMDTYFPFLDIVSANFYQDPSWVYVVVTLVGRDANNAFPAKYAMEADLNLDGRGDLLVMVNNPSSTDWSTDGVQVFRDGNGDIGGVSVINADSAGKGDGYETVVFDQGKGDDPDAAWARLSSSSPNDVELALKTTLLDGRSKYLAGVWAGTDALDPALFDFNDHFTHEQAGEANPDIANFYPIKALAELDNTCRQAIGLVPNGNEPALCAQGQ